MKKKRRKLVDKGSVLYCPIEVGGRYGVFVKTKSYPDVSVVITEREGNLVLSIQHHGFGRRLVVRPVVSNVVEVEIQHEEKA